MSQHPTHDPKRREGMNPETLKDERLEIRPMCVKMCPECFGLFRIGNRCSGCGSDVESEVFWTDDDGDTLFKLVSDVR